MMMHLQVFFVATKSVDYGDGCVIMMDANLVRMLLFDSIVLYGNKTTRRVASSAAETSKFSLENDDK